MECQKEKRNNRFYYQSGVGLAKMKRNNMFFGAILLLSGTLFTTGCHASVLSSMKPSAQKLAIGIVGSRELINTNDFQDYTAKVFRDSGVAFELRPAANDAEAKASLTALADNKNIDLILTESKYEQAVKDLSKTHTQTKIGIIGLDAKSDSQNIRSVNVNREFQSFVAGYLVASVNSKQPIGVIVQNIKSLADPEWKGLLEGIHYAGSSLSPVVLTVDDIMTHNGLLKIKASLPRTFILLDSVTDSELARLHISGKWLFATQDLPKMYPSVIARPKPFFAEGVQEEVQALLNNSWQGNASSVVATSAFFDILRPDVLPGVTERKKSVEEGLKNRTIQPGDYEKPPVEEVKSKPF